MQEVKDTKERDVKTLKSDKSETTSWEKTITQRFSSPTIALKCASCGYDYELGKTGSVMTDKVAMSMMGDAVVIVSGGQKSPVDAIYPAKDSEWTSKLRSTTKESSAEIRNGLAAGQKRRWNCWVCGREQDYATTP